MSYAFTLTGNNLGVMRSDGAAIPNDPGNIDWQAYQIWLAAGNKPNPTPTLAPIVPEEVSDRQFFQQLAIQDLIKQSEALAYVTVGTLPAVFTNAIDALPTANNVQFGARMAIIGAKTFNRHNPITIMLGTALNQTSDQLDAFWIAAAALT